MDDEVYGLRQTVAEQTRTIQRLEAEVVRLRTRLCDPHQPVMTGNFVWVCDKCGKWLPDDPM